MIIEYIRYRIGSDLAEQFEAAYQEASKPLAASANCVGFELARCHEEPDRYILRITWDSLDGHLVGFRRSPEFRDFFSHIRPFVDAIEEMQHYRPTEVVGTGSAGSAPR